jgi:probable F420-dependent oxidoreductase
MKLLARPQRATLSALYPRSTPIVTRHSTTPACGPLLAFSLVESGHLGRSPALLRFAQSSSCAAVGSHCSSSSDAEVPGRTAARFPLSTGRAATREDVAMTLPVGLALPTTPELTRPLALAELARTAEQLGYAHLWVSDHVLLPSGSHVPADHQLDPFASLAWLAAHTRRIGLGTSVLVLPYRGAAATAKALATIDWLSGGRLIVGVGAGWLRAEFAALGVPFDERGSRTDGAIRALRDLWAGRGDLTCLPAGAPERRSAIPIVVGGSSRAALKRAARIGDGWHPLNLVGVGLSEGVARYRAACAACERPIGRVVARVFPPGLKPGPERDVLMGDDAVAARELLAAFSAAGTDELVISWHDADVDAREVLGRWERFAAALGHEAAPRA